VHGSVNSLSSATGVRGTRIVKARFFLRRRMSGPSHLPRVGPADSCKCRLRRDWFPGGDFISAQYADPLLSPLTVAFALFQFPSVSIAPQTMR